LATNGSITINAVGPPLPVVTLTATGAPAEAGPLAGQFVIARDLATGPLTVALAISGTATPLTDFAALPSEVTLPDGAATAIVTLTPVDDAVADADETVVLTLASGTAYAIGTPATATHTILDNDGPQPVGPPWSAHAVGAVMAGANNATASTGAGANSTDLFSITGSGSVSTGNSSDGMYFVAQPVTGDCEIIARVASHSGTGTNHRVGVAIRADLTGGAVAAHTLLRGGTRSPYFLRRATANTASTSSQFGSSVTAPYWVKLTRVGSEFTAFVSPDGVTWSPIGSAITLANMPPTAHAGLFVASGSTTSTNTATFDNVSVKYNLVTVAGPAAAPAEGTPVQPAAFTISRGSQPPASTLAIPLTLSGAAAHGIDYELSGGGVTVIGNTATVTLPAGESQVQLLLTPLNDLLNEGGETVTITVPSAATYSLGIPATASATIGDAPVATLTTSAAPAEGGTTTGAGTFHLNSAQPVTATPAAGWQFVNWTGTGIADPASPATTVVIDTTKTVTANFQPINPDANGNGMLDTWEIANFGNADPGNNPPQDDPDHDGFANLMEYALGTDPLRPNPGPLNCALEPYDGQTFLRLVVPKNPAATNLTYTVQTGGSLTDWSATDTAIEVDTATQVVVRDTIPLSAAARRFIRLKVTVSP
jgi:hypothetical protein